MRIAVVDRRGRITIGKSIAKDYGREFFIFATNDKIILRPKLTDPIKDLRELGKKAGINKLSRKQIKKIIQEEAEKEVAEEFP